MMRMSRRSPGHRLALAAVVTVYVQACTNPADSKPVGRYSVEIVEVTDQHYDEDYMELQLGARSALVWDNPVGDEELTGVFVRVRIGSATGNYAFAPIRSWLASEGSGRAPIVELRRHRRELRVEDPDRLLLGQRVGVAVPHKDYRSGHLVTHEITITANDYRDLYRPTFTNGAVVDSPWVYITGDGNFGEEYFHGTYVAAWVIGEGDEPAYTPAEEWLLSEAHWGEGNLYGTEVAWGVRFRDRAKALNGRRVLIASVPE